MVNDKSEIQLAYRQLENTVSDLRNATFQTFQRHIEKLSRQLHSSPLAEISAQLVADIDIEKWLEEGEAAGGSMAGSAQLTWPADHKQELGLVIALIDKFAKNKGEAEQFSFTFYYNGSNITANLNGMTEQIIVPFSRDYIEFAKQSTGGEEMTSAPAPSGPAPRKVFIVHGHDQAMKEAVARFVQKCAFEPIILHEQPSSGRTIMEKIEAHRDVGFAVVLLSPDDVGGRSNAELSSRARQNVILELGYFLGSLGRARVAALKRGDVEVPSDYHGVAYVSFDDGSGWKQELGRELQAAGFEIDWNNVMRA